MSGNLLFLAGETALYHVREHGLRPESVGILAGAAGGPKWLVLSALDRFLTSWLVLNRKTLLRLIGSSIGAWRFAAYSMKNPVRALELFEDEYINQFYDHRPTPAEVTRESYRIFDAFTGKNGTAEILSNPYIRLNVLSARCRWPLSSDRTVPLALGLSAAALANLLRRRWIGAFFERTLFHDSRDFTPFFSTDGFSLQGIALSERNLRKALMASGSIPLVMSRVTDIEGAPPGSYRDGGLIDYHLDLPFLPGDGIVLFPHYLDRIIPGWFDKKLFWRSASPANFKNVLLVCPSREFVARLPHGKIPDRDDFVRFYRRDDERISYWRKVAQAGSMLVDEFHEAVESGSIKRLIKPLR